MNAKNVTSANLPRTGIIVLGMHRSGTSVLSNVLAEFGCELPETLMQASPYNERGYFESQKVCQLNDLVLDSAGTAWDDWKLIADEWFDHPSKLALRQRAVDVLEAEFGDSPLFVLKDPRICRLMPFWVDVFKESGCTPKVIHIHRNPLDVAASIRKRDGFSVEFSLLVWLRYLLEAETGSRGMLRSFTSYDALMSDVGKQVEKMQRDLGTRFPKMNDETLRNVQQVVSPDLRHFDRTAEQVLVNPAVSEWVRDVYGVLERWADTGEDPIDHVTFDRIREDLNSSYVAFLSVVESERALSAQIAEVVVARKDMKDRLHQTESALSIRFHEIASLTDALVAKEMELEEHGAIVHQLQQELEQRDAAADDARQEAELWAADVAALRNSTSWRLTAPLRRIASLVGRR